MAVNWRHTPPRLYERCDGAVRLRGILVAGRPITMAEAQAATFTLVVKDSEEAADDTGDTYTGQVQPDPDDADKPMVMYPIPKADLETPGERWGYATMTDVSGRWLVGYGPVFVQGL